MRPWASHLSSYQPRQFSEILEGISLLRVPYANEIPDQPPPLQKSVLGTVDVRHIKTKMKCYCPQKAYMLDVHR